MAGNPGDSEAANQEPQKPNTPKVKTFSCAECGASVTVRYPGLSMSAVCESCHSIIDVTDNNFRVLSAYSTATAKYRPIIPLGTRGQLAGKTWEVIGYMVRNTDASVSTNQFMTSVAQPEYFWDEYLLFNPYYGFRWLVEDQGHWNLVRTIKQKPDFFGTRDNIASLAGKTYKLFNRGNANVAYVLGEFYWRVSTQSKVLMTDYICPPEMLSREQDEHEVVWSIGEYIEAANITEAFKLKAPLPSQIGIGPNQPPKEQIVWKKIAKLWLIFIAILTAAQFVQLATATNKTVVQTPLSFAANGKTNDVTIPMFTLDKDSANVTIRFTAPVDNSWFYVSGELVNNANGLTYPFEQTVEYYHGSDSDGAWSEGDQSSEFMISSVPGGQYYLNLDTESGSFPDTSLRIFTVAVKRDVPTYANYFWCLFFLSIVPAIAWCTMRQTEIARWRNSDFSPYQPKTTALISGG